MDETDAVGEEYADLHRSVQDPAGHAYEVFVQSGHGGAGPALLGADAGAPAVVHRLADRVNRALGRLPRRVASYTFPIVYVLRRTDDGGVRQDQMTFTSDRAEAETVVADVVTRIESGAFVPEGDNGL